MAKPNPISNVQIATKCPMCDLNFNKEDVKTIDKKEGATTFFLNCSKCKSSVMMVIMTSALGITSISIVSDLAENDINKIKASCVEYDDVLEMHKFLKNK
jgi:transcription elongation factor Elf1